MINSIKTPAIFKGTALPAPERHEYTREIMCPPHVVFYETHLPISAFAAQLLNQDKNRHIKCNPGNHACITGIAKFHVPCPTVLLQESLVRVMIVLSGSILIFSGTRTSRHPI